MTDPTIRRDDSLLCGRLVALPSTTSAAYRKVVRDQADPDYKKTISVDFPAMPDVIELARAADYTVKYNLVAPDGIHQYMGTKPLEIPISFRLHSFDQQYCKRGALTLLQLASRLHSFVLPISTFGNSYVSNAASTQTTEGGGQKPIADVDSKASQETVYTVTGTNKGGAIFTPVTCWLHCMWTDNNGPGISAIGYVKEVSVKFNGPWLRGGPTGSSFNLPSSADFSFVFVHRPGHGNAIPSTNSKFPPMLPTSTHFYADNVKDKLYNSRSLVSAASSYQGFANNPSNLIS